MPAGLQVFDETGRVTFNTNYRVSRMLGQLQAGLGTYTHYDDRLLTGIPFAVHVFEGTSTAFGPYDVIPQMTAPRVTFSGNSMTITRSGPPAHGQTNVCTVYYGVR